MSEILHKDIDYRALRMIVGLIALSIAIVCTGLFWFHTETSIIPTSISVTYHLGARDFFVGALFSVGGFLIAYKGWTDTELWLAKIAGVCAILIAVCPTSVNLKWIENTDLPFDKTQCKICETAESLNINGLTGTGDNNSSMQESPSAELDNDDGKCITTGSKFTPVVHGVAAFTLIAILFYYCIGFYRRVDGKIKKHPDMKLLKWRRFIYLACAVSMAISAVIGGILQWVSSNPGNTAIFWVEFVCLWAFGISWIVASKRAWLISYDKETEAQADN